MDCNNCVMVCPFNKPRGHVHDLVRFSIRRFPVFNRFLVFMDDLMGYGKAIQTHEKSFWEQ